MDTNQHSRIILEYLAGIKLTVGDGSPIDDVIDFGIERGLGLEEMEDALIQASSHGWISIHDNYLTLSEKGFALLSHANDNGLDESPI